MTKSEYIDAMKLKLGLTSDYATANELGIARSTLKGYRDDRTNFDDYMCFKVAEILGIDAKIVITDIRAQSEKNEDKREFWLEQKQKFSIKTVGIFGFWSVAGSYLTGIWETS